jgi:hypothetical protein
MTIYTTAELRTREWEALLARIAATARSLHEAEKAMRADGNTYGIEYVAVEDRELAYINVGDTYAPTIGQEGGGPLFVTSWGDWLEGAEQDYCEENDCTRCGYCGEFTPLGDDWRNTRCEHCGRNVSTGEPMDALRDEDGEEE